MTDTGWFGRRGIAQLAASQQKSVGGISAVTRTCIAAYKQFDDLEWVLKWADTMSMGDTDTAQLEKIKERHEKYRAAQAAEVMPEAP